MNIRSIMRYQLWWNLLYEPRAGSAPVPMLHMVGFGELVHLVSHLGGTIEGAAFKNVLHAHYMVVA